MSRTLVGDVRRISHRLNRRLHLRSVGAELLAFLIIAAVYIGLMFICAVIG